jgi:hypothetical protein
MSIGAIVMIAYGHRGWRHYWARQQARWLNPRPARAYLSHDSTAHHRTCRSMISVTKESGGVGPSVVDLGKIVFGVVKLTGAPVIGCRFICYTGR